MDEAAQVGTKKNPPRELQVVVQDSCKARLEIRGPCSTLGKTAEHPKARINEGSFIAQRTLVSVGIVTRVVGKKNSENINSRSSTSY